MQEIEIKKHEITMYHSRAITRSNHSRNVRLGISPSTQVQDLYVETTGNSTAVFASLSISKALTKILYPQFSVS